MPVAVGVVSNSPSRDEREQEAMQHGGGREQGKITGAPLTNLAKTDK